MKIEMGIGWLPDGPGKLRSANPGEYADEIVRLHEALKLLNLENGRLKRELRALSPCDDGEQVT